MKSKRLLRSLKPFKCISIPALLCFVFAAQDAGAVSCKVVIHPCTITGCDLSRKLAVTIPIQEEQSTPYNRREFLEYSGGRWDDQDHDCQDTRAEVLNETSLIPVVYSLDGCRVEMGLWYDPYSGLMFENAHDLDIDHLVPIKEAHESGASEWKPVDRARFANSYRVSANLIPVWKSLNRSKGAKEPMGWLPPNKEYVCEYINRWAYVKWFSGLSVDPDECSYIIERLNRCLD